MAQASAAEGPTDCPEPALHGHVPPGYSERDHTNRATHLITCVACGHREGWRTSEPFGRVKAHTAARKAGWLRSPDAFGEAPQFTCPTCQREKSP